MTDNQTGQLDPSPVSVIGLGMMGSALADAFLDHGHPTTVWNRSAGKADDLVAKGATRATTVTEAVSASPVVVVCVLDYAATHEILEPVGDALSDRVLVNLTNGTPEQARSMATWAVECGADYLDGGIMAVPQLIAEPDALLLYSGSQSAFETHQRVLEILGTSKYLGDDARLASLYDLALLSAMYGMFGGFLHAVALVSTEETEAVEFTTSLMIPWLNAMITSLPQLAEDVDTGDYSTNGSALDMQAVGIANIVDASKTQGISTDLMSPMQALVDQRVAEGHDGDDLSSLVELIREPASTE